MGFKKLIIATVLFVTSANAQFRGNDYGMPVPGQCNETLCHFPCEGAAPPPKCPTYMPDCRSGCACFMDCSTDTLICFMTKHCQQRRYITRRRYARGLSQEVDFHSSTQALGRLKRDLSLYTVAKFVSERAENNFSAVIEAQSIKDKGQNVSSSTVTNDINGHKRDLVVTTVRQAVRQHDEDISETIVAHNVDEKIILTIPNGTMAVSQRAEPELPGLTIADTLNVRKERDLPSSTQSKTIISNEEQNLSESTVASAIDFRAGNDRNFPNIQNNRDREREKEMEKQADKLIKEAIEKAFQEKKKKLIEKAAELAAEKVIKAKSKLGAGTTVAVDAAAACVVFIACLNRCISSVVSWNI